MATDVVRYVLEVGDRKCYSSFVFLEKNGRVRPSVWRIETGARFTESTPTYWLVASAAGQRATLAFFCLLCLCLCVRET